MKHPVFVISTGRTGTTFLAETISKLGGNAAHEPGPRWLRLASNAHVAGDLSHERSVQLIQKVRPPEKTYDVEASCLIYGLSGPILDAKPDAYVVHLVRDPRTYVRSAMNWGVHRLGGRPLNLIPYRRLALPHLTGRSPRTMLQWAKRDQFSRVCWTWAEMNRAMQRHGKGRDRFMRIRMEDVFDADAGYSGFAQILELAGLPVPGTEVLKETLSQKINAAPRQSFPRWEHWTESQLEILLTECGELAETYGYPVAGEIESLLRTRSFA